MERELVSMFLASIIPVAMYLLNQSRQHRHQLEKIRIVTAQIEAETAALKGEANGLMPSPIIDEPTRPRSGTELGIYEA